MLIDLHMHSTASDGDLTPQELVSLVHQCNVTVMALTDHDTVAGVARAQEIAELIGLQCIAGVEVTSRYGQLGLHIVGLNVDIHNEEFLAFLQSQSERRHIRGQQIQDKLTACGLPDVYEKALKYAGNPFILSRSHFASVLYDEGVVATRQEAFDRYLGDRAPCFVQMDWPEVQQTIEAIHQAGGLAILAHPGRYRYDNDLHRDIVLQVFADAGGDGLEVTSGSQSDSHTPTYVQACKDLGLLASTGSDFHRIEGMRPLPGQQLPIPKGLKTVLDVLD